MSTLLKGSDLVYRLQVKYNYSTTVQDPADYTTIVANFTHGTTVVEYSLADSEIVINGKFIDILVQRADFDSKNIGSYCLTLTTEEDDSNYEDNKRVRKGELKNAFTLLKPC
jgi:hypothetical protein